MIKRSLTAVLVIVLFTLTACGNNESVQSESARHTHSFFAMDTFLTFTAYGEDAQASLEMTEERFAELERLWSVTDENSDIYAVNHSNGEPVIIHEDTAELLSFAIQMADETKGVLEPTIYPVLTAWGFTTEKNRVPSDDELQQLLQHTGYEKISLNDNTVQIDQGMQLDLGAVGKGAAGDEAVRILKEYGVTSALLDVGGNIQAIGSRPDGSNWRLGIQNPLGEGNIGVLEVSDQAVVTSGNYERFFTDGDGNEYGHIINPATGYPSDSGLASVTIIAEEGKRSDALSTALFVFGLEGAIDYWEKSQNFDMILVAENGDIYLTENIASDFSAGSEYDEEKVHMIADE